MSEEQTIKCPICGKPYVFMPFYAGDQSACPECRAKARGLKGYYKHKTTNGTSDIQVDDESENKEGKHENRGYAKIS